MLSERRWKPGAGSLSEIERTIGQTSSDRTRVGRLGRVGSVTRRFQALLALASIRMADLTRGMVDPGLEDERPDRVGDGDHVQEVVVVVDSTSGMNN
ncbi:hypothetical protein VTH06DRAFT_6003 [Thermothelomyces fergusii]